RIGIEETMPFVFADGMARALPAGQVASATAVTAGCRVIKDAHEIALMRRAGEITLRAHRAVFASLKEGVTQAEASRLSAEAHRPGAECQAVDAAARTVIVDAGFGPDYRYFTHRVGHGIGMDGHEWTYLVRGNATKLRPGMCFSDEPGIYIPGEMGIRHEDVIF